MLVAELDKRGPDAEAVTLMALDNGKGLEFPVVFITGLEDGLLPLARAYDEPALLEEERRLFYVGITRAKRKLFLSHAEERRRNGEFFPSKPSSFLAGISDGLLELRKTIKVRSSGRSFMNSMSGGQWRGAQARATVDDVLKSAVLDDDAAFRQRSAAVRRPGMPITAFEDADVSQDAAVIVVGARVRHRKFGTGIITELARAGRDLKPNIHSDHNPTRRKTLLAARPHF